jgi:hypothetical protein
MVCFAVLFVSVLAPPLLIKAQAQQQQQVQQDKEKLFLSFKLVDPHPDSYYRNATNYDISKVISNNMNKSIPNYMNKKIEFNLKNNFNINTNVRISDNNIDWTIPFTVIDTSTPNVIRSQQGTLGASALTSNLTKEHNTITNITTYTGQSGLFVNYSNIADVDVKVTIYPNDTGIIETRQQ